MTTKENKEFARTVNMERAVWKLLGMRKSLGDHDLIMCLMAAMSKPTKVYPHGATLRAKITYPKPPKRITKKDSKT
jgi:hypothetical protein